jgi:hypothetical protein
LKYSISDAKQQMLGRVSPLIDAVLHQAIRASNLLEQKVLTLLCLQVLHLVSTILGLDDAQRRRLEQARGYSSPTPHYLTTHAQKPGRKCT